MIHRHLRDSYAQDDGFACALWWHEGVRVTTRFVHLNDFSITSPFLKPPEFEWLINLVSFNQPVPQSWDPEIPRLDSLVNGRLFVPPQAHLIDDRGPQSDPMKSYTVCHLLNICNPVYQLTICRCFYRLSTCSVRRGLSRCCRLIYFLVVENVDRIPKRELEEPWCPRPFTYNAMLQTLHVALRLISKKHPPHFFRHILMWLHIFVKGP